MKRYLCIFLAIVYAALQGCAAPGSAIGRIRIDGEFNPPPSEKLKLRITLDKQYGLGGLDEYLGEPEDYGNEEKINILTVDEDGIFYGPEAQIIYHITFWILPPLGVYPNAPPKPYFFLEISNKKEEIYLVGDTDNGFDYKVFNIPSRDEISKEDAYWAIKSGKYLPIENDGPKGWRLKLQIEKNNKNL